MTYSFYFGNYQFMKRIKTVEWVSKSAHSIMPGKVRFIDQTKLPNKFLHISTTDIDTIWHAIKQLKVRGAPAIGVAAAFGIAAHVQDSREKTTAKLLKAAEKAGKYLATSRPTAVNLFWAIDRMIIFARAAANLAPKDFKESLICEAIAIRDNDAEMCLKIGTHGSKLIKNGFTILTHCNAGGLATAEIGTALAPMYVAKDKGLQIKVYADETRPLLQGARLTAWELMQNGIDVTLICDNTAGWLMKQGKIDCVMVGADRIAANGDSANKIGTYSVAVLAKEHGIPFYVLAPSSTFDPKLTSGDQIPIEERAPEEVTCGFGRRTAPETVKVYSPAFDVTPARLISAIVCERGILRPPFKGKIR